MSDALELMQGSALVADHAAAATKMAEKLNNGQEAVTVPVPMATKNGNPF